MDINGIVIELVSKVSSLQARVDMMWQIGIILTTAVIGTLVTNIWQIILIKKNGNGHKEVKTP